MNIQQIVVDSYFDGKHYHNKGPYTIELRGAVIDSIRKGDCTPEGSESKRACFMMPGMVEAHCHLFLDGGELDFNKRSVYLKSSNEEMIKVGRQSIAQSLDAGITLIRDAGDIHGINTHLRDELTLMTTPQPVVRSPGTAIRKNKRYGSFMAKEVTDKTSLQKLMSVMPDGVDDIKILMTGIIDFEVGEVKGAPQFSLEETRCIVCNAKALDRLTFAHCSGADGIDIAIEAGLDSIEHGFFITKSQLQLMADKGITWVPTFSPVHFQWQRPELAGWNERTVINLRGILDAHAEQLYYAYQIGVSVLVGSDAGSYGVQHGQSYIGELMLMAATGCDLEKILHSATSLPRSVWGYESVDITPGSKAELVLLDSSPFEELEALKRVVAVYKDGWHKPAKQIAGVAA